MSSYIMTSSDHDPEACNGEGLHIPEGAVITNAHKELVTEVDGPNDPVPGLAVQMTYVFGRWAGHDVTVVREACEPFATEFDGIQLSLLDEVQ